MNSQSSITIFAGRGLKWRVGWKVRIYNAVTGLVISEAINEILTITGDTITFVSPFVTTLTTNIKIKFPNFSELAATDDQKRYAFVSDGSSNFADGTPPYQVTY